VTPATATHSTKGFTLLELLIVVSLVVILMLSATSLFLTFLIGNSKSNAIQTVKNEGTYALSQMEFLIRNAINIAPNSSDVSCGEDMNEFVIVSIDGNSTTFFAEEDNGVDKIASNSGVYLTSDEVELVAGPEFDCAQASGSNQSYVNVSFTLRKGSPGVDQATEIVEQQFETSVNIRSF
jgi:prepilin-type N-terminal cleavage/methylation domain-containing protein